MSEDEVMDYLRANPDAASRIASRLRFLGPWELDEEHGYRFRRGISGMESIEATVNPPDEECCPHCGEQLSGRSWNWDLSIGRAAVERSGTEFGTVEEAMSDLDRVLRERGFELG